MIRWIGIIRTNYLLAWTTVFFLSLSALNQGNVLAGEISMAPEMPSDWVIISDVQVPAEQVKAISEKLGAELSSVRNTIYDVRGKHVQINVIETPDSLNAENLMTKLGTMKAPEALLRKDLIVYEFVGPNDVLPEIAEGRNHLDSK